MSEPYKEAQAKQTDSEQTGSTTLRFAVAPGEEKDPLLTRQVFWLL
jgi:hypothetical protein